MKPKTSPFYLCRLRKRPDAHCRTLRRCRQCGRALLSVFADDICTPCASTVNVKGGWKCK